MGRPKKPTDELATIEDANRAMRRLLVAEVELEKQQGALDLAIAGTTRSFEAVIDKHKAIIADLTAQLQHWYMANHAELERDGKKSVRLTHGVVGRRLGNPALKPLNRAWTWAAIATALRAAFGKRYFHTPPEPKPDRDLIRAELTPEQLKSVGLKVDQDENFFAEPDRTTLGDAA